MSRETYFRAWDTYNEAWADEYLAIAEDGHVIEIKNDGTTEYWKDRFIIEFDTGLKDKNGKKICEGDIIQEEIDFNSKMTDGTFRYRVYWNEEELCWCLEHIGNESIHHELWQCNESTEVIGNIHENGDLLKEKE